MSLASLGWSRTPDGVRLLKPWQLATLAACGLAFDIAVQSGPATLASATLVVVVSTVLLVAGRIEKASARAMAGAAPLFGVFLCWRASPWLVVLDILAAAGLLCAAAVFSRRGRFFDTPLAAVAGATWRAGRDALGAATLVNRSLAAHVPNARSERGHAVLLGIALAAPLVLLLGALLASADAVFAALIPARDLPAWTRHAVLAVAGFSVAAALVEVSGGERPDRPASLRRLHPRTTDVVLVALVLLYGVYTATTTVAAAAGASAFVDDPQKVAEWARTGFFQLLAVAAITLAVVVALRATTAFAGRTDTRRFRAFSTVAVLLTLVIVVAAIFRINAYSEAYGLTMLRLYSGLFASWLGIVFLLFLGAAWGIGGRREWWPAATATSGLGLLLVLNVVRPEPVAVRYNLTHRNSVERFDAAYLASLSDDAVPALIGGFDRLTPADQEVILEALCPSRGTADAGLTWNHARRSAANALAAACRP